MNGITPELFATSWLLTLFTCKTNDIQTLYYLLEELVIEYDPLFGVYLGISFLQKHKNDLLSTEEVMLPQTICGMSILDQDYLAEIIANARELKRNMPYSLHIKLSEFNIYDLGDLDYIINALEHEFCLAIDPREVLSRVYPEAKVCDCIEICEWCKPRERAALLCLDVRTEAEQRAGAVPNSLPISDLAYSNREVMLDFPDEFIEMRGVVHFCIIGRSKFKSKRFDLGNATAAGQEDPVQTMIENLLQAFVIKGFPYISVVDGGFLECHELAKDYQLVVDDHDEKKCLACKASRSRESKNGRESKGEFKEPEGIPQTRSLSDPISLENVKADPTATCYSCRAFDKETNKALPGDYILIVTKSFIVIGQEETKGRRSKIVEQMKLETLSKIKSYTKDSKVLTLLFDGTKKLFCYVLNSQSDTKKFIQLTKKHYSALKGSF